jgi:hypothetical protein
MLENEEGTVPLIVLLLKASTSSAVKAPRLVGIDPLSLFPSKCNTRNSVKLPQDDGMLLDKELFPNSINCSLLKSDQSAGNVPLMPGCCEITIPVRPGRPLSTAARGSVPSSPCMRVPDQAETRFTMSVPFVQRTPRHLQ